MKKILVIFLGVLIAAFAYAQQPKTTTKEASPEITELKAKRDTLKAQLRVARVEHKRNISHYDKMANSIQMLKEKMKTAKKAKDNEKMEALQEKLTLTTDSLKELNVQLKDEAKALSTLEKDYDDSEKALEKQKDIEMKEKAKGRKK